MTEPNTSWAQTEGGSGAPNPYLAPGPGIQGPGIPAPTPAPVVTPKKKGSNLTNVLLAVAAVIAIGGITFAVGRATAPTATAGGFPGANGGQGFTPNGSFTPGQGGPGGFGGDGGITISGTVKSIDGTTMTVTTAAGTETTIDISGSTYHSQAAATAADVKAGSAVAVTVTGFGGFRGGAPGASGAPRASGAPGGGTGTIKATDVTIKAN
jgi:hypothetical protein